MTTDKKQPPDTDRPCLVLRSPSGEIRTAFHRDGAWFIDRQTVLLRGDVIDWRELPSWERLAILDRYDEERAEWERNIAGFKTAAEKWHREYKEVEARADRAEKERDEAQQSSKINFLSAMEAFKERDEANEERDRAIAERDDLGCQFEALRSIQRDDMQALLGRVAAIEKWRIGAERMFPLLVDVDCFGMTEDEIRKELAADGIDLDESRARLTARWRRILSETEADDDEKGGA